MTEGEKEGLSTLMGILITGAVVALGNYLDELPHKKNEVKAPVIIENKDSQKAFENQFQEKDIVKKTFQKEFTKAVEPIRNILHKKDNEKSEDL
ncbi:MAG: hypothetical protein PHQ52_07945 [Candidatus Omnitrophica bacterium]|nr:hypothetical protein [Candidatus Omnitrophota bacterium]